ncbi:hypothetical protein BDW59DRAFT_159095 [Aspergillus cavernicola]|uniref:Uncharacterized protein n=1 Tax=Aspergillus cavernicola TaxID=176166 RepID=A0ABR4IP22_9EURO
MPLTPRTQFGAKAETLDRPVFETEHFHRVLISLGHAARRMPRLLSMRYDLDHSPRFLFTFVTRSEAGGAGAEWSLESPYRPDQRVAGAWGCPLVELDAELVADECKII